MMKITFALVAGLLLTSTSAMSEMGYQLRETTIDSNSLSSAEEKLRMAYELCEADFAPGVNGLQHVYSVPECQKIKQLWDKSGGRMGSRAAPPRAARSRCGNEDARCKA